MSVLTYAEDELDEKIRRVKVASREAIKIPAKSMETSVGYTRTKNKRNQYVIAIKAISSRNIIVVYTVSNVHVEDGKNPVRILNIGEEDIWIQPKIRIGTLHHIEILKCSDQEYTVDIEQTEMNIRRVSVLINTIASENSELTSNLDLGKFNLHLIKNINT